MGVGGVVWLLSHRAPTNVDILPAARAATPTHQSPPSGVTSIAPVPSAASQEDKFNDKKEQPKVKSTRQVSEEKKTTFQQTNQPGSIGIQGTGNNVTINQQAGWPSISVGLVDQAVALLKPFSGQRVRIEAANGPDSNRLRVVQELASIFSRAGWRYEPGQMIMGLGPNGSPQGLGVRVKTVTPAAEALLQVLASIYGIDNIPERRQDGSFEDGLIEISVRPKKL